MTNPGGRPEIGGAVHIRLGALTTHVDTYATRVRITRAEAVRRLVSHGLESAPPPIPECAHTVDADAATAEWLTGGMTDLAANGLRPTREDDGRVRLPEGAAAWLAEHTTEDDDGHVEVADDGTVLLWAEGEPHTLTPA